MRDWLEQRDEDFSLPNWCWILLGLTTAALWVVPFWLPEGGPLRGTWVGVCSVG